MKKNRFILIAAAIVLALSLVGCAARNAPVENVLPTGGVLFLSVNPEIAISYDADGMVTGLEARNEDAKAVIEGYTGFEGRECSAVVTELVGLIGEAGYFVEELDGERRQITIEIERGSQLPSEVFLDEIVEDVRAYVNSNAWASPVALEGTTDYGITDYVDTDYGPGNDGVTDYVDTDYGPNNDGVTDYIDTDYGPNNDGITDYIDTDYGLGNDGVTDYGVTDYGKTEIPASTTEPPAVVPETPIVDTDYGPGNDGVTDYIDTDYGPNNDGITDYNDTDYGPGNDGITDYIDTDYGPNNDGVTDYNTGSSDYGSNYGSNYGSDYD